MDSEPFQRLLGESEVDDVGWASFCFDFSGEFSKYWFSCLTLSVLQRKEAHWFREKVLNELDASMTG